MTKKDRELLQKTIDVLSANKTVDDLYPHIYIYVAVIRHHSQMYMTYDVIDMARYSYHPNLTEGQEIYLNNNVYRVGKIIYSLNKPDAYFVFVTNDPMVEQLDRFMSKNDISRLVKETYAEKDFSQIKKLL